jgi:ion channel-forming bestrophin family protein
MIPSTEMPSGPSDRRVFWRHIWALSGSVSLRVLPRVFVFAVWAALVAIEQPLIGHTGLEVGPVELAGGALVLLMVLRTNAGYDRWWEGRKLWGGIVNQSRNFAISTLAYTPSADRSFRDRVTRWAAVFPHIAKKSLRSDRDLPEVAALLGADAAAKLSNAEHMPSAVAYHMATLLREGVDKHGLPPFAFLQCDKERATLIDHIGACERILKTPLPLVYAIKLRRFVALYLMVLPFALVERVGWLSPLLVALVAYPVLGIDQIAVELENPFSKDNMSHLPLDTICNTIQGNVLALVDAPPMPEADPPAT